MNLAEKVNEFLDADRTGKQKAFGLTRSDKRVVKLGDPGAQELLGKPAKAHRSELKPTA